MLQKFCSVIFVSQTAQEGKLSTLISKADGRVVRSEGGGGKSSNVRFSKWGWRWLSQRLQIIVTPTTSSMPYPLSSSLSLFIRKRTRNRARVVSLPQSLPMNGAMTTLHSVMNAWHECRGMRRTRVMKEAGGRPKNTVGENSTRETVI